MEKQIKNKNILYIAIGLVVLAVFIFIFSDERKTNDNNVVYNQYQQKIDEIKIDNQEVKKDEIKKEKIIPKPKPYIEPSITVLSPNGGEKIMLQSSKNTYTIKWKTTGFSYGDLVNIILKDNSVNCIAIYPMPAPGCQHSFVIASVPNTGSFAWNLNEKMSGLSGPNSIPVYTGERFKIEITATPHSNGGILPFELIDQSDGEFTISSCPVYMPAPGWCFNGVVLPQTTDVNGCYLPPVCSYATS